MRSTLKIWAVSGMVDGMRHCGGLFYSRERHDEREQEGVVERAM